MSATASECMSFVVLTISHYLSLEFLVGRSLQNSLINLGIEDKYREALLDLGYVLEDIYEEVRDYSWIHCRKKMLLSATED